ncbi:MAG: DUF559 domain-containing protein [Abitibacteriaceae bacterium]|nr:DUF559 domain-containing protein [Abditibacteriaceae bacterium]
MKPQNIIVGQRIQAGKQEKAKAMRRDMTPAERALWQRLRNHQLQGLHFRRQQVIFGVIADFYCHEVALVVEVDGGYHDPGHDAERDAILAAQGITTLRFSNNEVLHNRQAVLARIAAQAVKP